MSSVKVDGFQSSAIIEALENAFKGYSEKEKKEQINKTKGIFELHIKNDQDQEAVWAIDLKKTGTVYTGAAKPKPDVTINMSDETFMQLAEGKLNGQKAFMTGKLKTKGNMMLATKLDGVLKSVKAQSKI